MHQMWFVFCFFFFFFWSTCQEVKCQAWYSNRGFIQESRHLQNNGDYNFGFSQAHSDGSSFRQERRHGNAVTGSYGMKLPDGRSRIVRYIADARGYRAFVDSNEPGYLAPRYAVKPVSGVAPIWRPTRLSTVKSAPEMRPAKVQPSADLIEQIRQQQLRAQQRLMQQQARQKQEQERAQQERAQQLQRMREWQKQLQAQLDQQLELARKRIAIKQSSADQSENQQQQPLVRNIQSDNNESKIKNDYIAPLPLPSQENNPKQSTLIDSNQSNLKRWDVQKQVRKDNQGNQQVRVRAQFVRVRKVQANDVKGSRQALRKATTPSTSTSTSTSSSSSSLNTSTETPTTTSLPSNLTEVTTSVTTSTSTELTTSISTTTSSSNESTTSDIKTIDLNEESDGDSLAVVLNLTTTTVQPSTTLASTTLTSSTEDSTNPSTILSSLQTTTANQELVSTTTLTTTTLQSTDSPTTQTTQTELSTLPTNSNSTTSTPQPTTEKQELNSSIKPTEDRSARLVNGTKSSKSVQGESPKWTFYRKSPASKNRKSRLTNEQLERKAEASSFE